MTSTLDAIKIARRKIAKKGIQFSIMVCGASGTGRTTFINTLCGKTVLHPKDTSDVKRAHLDDSVQMKSVTVELELKEEETRLALTIVDTPGFGDQIDNEASFDEIINFLKKQYDDVLAVDCRIKRKPIFRDNRVHALLYFIVPTGHGLRALDIELMQRLSPWVNVIPVLGKADSLTSTELIESKRLIMEDIDHYNIPVYDFPYDIDEDDDDTIKENQQLRGLMPFAIIGSEQVIEICGNRVRARQYPWGIVEVDDPNNSDFLALESALLHSHLEDLKEITNEILYENYRTDKLSETLQSTARIDYTMNREDLASQSVLLREEQLRREEEKLRELEIKLQLEINEKRQELLAHESQLEEIETRMHHEHSTLETMPRAYYV